MHLNPLLLNPLLRDLTFDGIESDGRNWCHHLQQLPEAVWKSVGAADRACGLLERGMIERLWRYAETVTTQVRTT